MDELTYRMATEQAVWIDDYHLSWLQVRGHDRGQFLQNLCTNDVLKLSPNCGCEAFFTNVQGKVIGFAVIFAEDESLTVMTERGQAEVLLAHLDKYLIREDVDLQDVSSLYTQILILGPGGRAIAEKLQLALSEVPWSSIGCYLELGACVYQASAFDVPALIVRCPRSQIESLHQLLDAANIEPCQHDVAELLRIEKGFPRYGIDVTEANLPQEVDRNESAISFTKGCYLGQETVARIDALGHVNKKLRRVSFSNACPPDVGAELMHNDQAAGTVTSAMASFKQGAVGLAYVRRGHEQQGTVLQVNGDQATVL